MSEGVYTIRAIRVDGDDVALLLAELVNPWFEWDGGNKGDFLSRLALPTREDNEP
jgi:hypothetical protein